VTTDSFFFPVVAHVFWPREAASVAGACIYSALDRGHGCDIGQREGGPSHWYEKNVSRTSSFNRVVIDRAAMSHG
jgi:hypothetical protein